MARLPRLDLISIAQHSGQRGDNRMGSFLDDGDGLRYLHLLREASLATGVLLYAFILMTGARTGSIDEPTNEEGHS